MDQSQPNWVVYSANFAWEPEDIQLHQKSNTLLSLEVLKKNHISNFMFQTKDEFLILFALIFTFEE